MLSPQPERKAAHLAEQVVQPERKVPYLEILPPQPERKAPRMEMLSPQIVRIRRPSPDEHLSQANPAQRVIKSLLARGQE
ncbi:hypothetical protein [Leptolyngbya sp. FACHB-261]|uniref:hypothetical protein n=1 Tax=Leptolyngbya sp. FACHB-261 TaxID=2692806 RepID=UPI001683713F|nr:hypothetical protein [Leptolyngbya sp. FACHB-261]MBD2099316.1 hypothetical protein [Leptolyngbya sp. FACHB-261]